MNTLKDCGPCKECGAKAGEPCTDNTGRDMGLAVHVFGGRHDKRGTK